MWRSLNKFHFQTAWTAAVARPVHCQKSREVRHGSVIANVKEPDNKKVRYVCFEQYSSDGKDSNGAKRRGTFNFIGNDCLEVFGWSGIIFLSYIWFPSCPRRNKLNPAKEYAYRCLPRSSSNEYTTLVKGLCTAILDSPINHVLPKVSATRSKQNSLSDTSEYESEILKENCENLEVAHKKVTSSLSNWLGTECMQSGEYDKAFNHFSEAASYNHAAALFNLGLCHEMGFGTKQSFKRAAELYKKASELGHATAMYNLGVFHVHGWGGLESNSNAARLLFETAAELGQIDARRALIGDDDETLEEPSRPEYDAGETGNQSSFQGIIEPRDNDITELWLKVLNINLNNVNAEPSVIPHKERLMSDDSGIIDLSPNNELFS